MSSVAIAEWIPHLGALLGFTLAFLWGSMGFYHVHNATKHSIRNLREEIPWGRVTDRNLPMVPIRGRPDELLGCLLNAGADLTRSTESHFAG